LPDEAKECALGQSERGVALTAGGFLSPAQFCAADFFLGSKLKTSFLDSHYY
jgi:hypothetical protein